MATYNGHRSWNAWNVSLWINNDEPMYRLAQECCREAKTLADATTRMLQYLGEGEKTPDGARYNRTCVREAIADIWADEKRK